MNTRNLLLALLLLAGLFAWFGVEPTAHALRSVDLRRVALYLTLTAVITALVGGRWQVVARALGGRASLGHLIMARLAGDAVGALVPSARLAGEPLRIALVRGGGAPTAQAAAGVAADRLLEVVGNLAAVLTYVVVFWCTRAEVDGGRAPLVLAAAMLLLAAALGLLIHRLRAGRRPLAPFYGARVRYLLPRLAPALDGLERVEVHLGDLLRQQPRALLAGVALSLLIEGLIVLQYHVLLGAFGVSLALPTLLLVLLGGGLANAAPMPAGLGALEAAQVVLVGLASGRPDIGLVVGVIVRLHETLLLGLGLAALSYQGLSLARLRLGAPRAVG